MCCLNFDSSFWFSVLSDQYQLLSLILVLGSISDQGVHFFHYMLNFSVFIMGHFLPIFFYDV